MRPLRPRSALALLGLLWLAVALGAPLFGSQPIGLSEVLRGDPTALAIFWQLRLPRVLLATFPRSSEEMAERGVSFLLEVARECPGIDFSLLSRPWRTGGTAAEATRRLIAAGNLTNVTLLDGVQEDMRALYLQHDFTVIPFTTPDGGKECPRSLVETMACGVPVLISEVAQFSAFVRERECGQVFALDPQSFAGAVDAALSRYQVIRDNAMRESRAQFDLRATMKSYAEIYEAAH